MISLENYLMDHRERFINELLDFLRFPSLSALPAHAGDVQRTQCVWGPMISCFSPRRHG